MQVDNSSINVLSFSTPVESYCIKCKRDDAVLQCAGCSGGFCYIGYGIHRDELSEELDEVEKNRDLIRQLLSESESHRQNHAELEGIDQWERDAIMQIKQAAADARAGIINYISKYSSGIRVQLTTLTERLRKAREENDFMEQHLFQWTKQLAELKERIIELSNVKVRYGSTYVVTKIFVDAPLLPAIPNIDINATWMQNGISVAGGNEKGNALNQLCDPTGLYVTDNQTVYVVDCLNHRIMEWKKDATSGRVVAGGNGRGSRNDQLNCPANVFVDDNSDSLLISDYGNRRIVRWPLRNRRSGETIISDVDCWCVTMDINGCLYVSDISKHEVKRYRRGVNYGEVVAGGNGRGNRLDQLNGPYYICVDHDLSVYISDYFNRRVMKWISGAEEGIVIAGGQGQGEGNSATQLSGPYGIAVDQAGSVYVAEWNNQRVIRWLKGATQGNVLVCGNEEGGEANQFNHPCDLSFDSQNNLYVADYYNCRVQKFNIDTSQNSV